MRTRLWSCLGWRRFPRDMTAFEARRFVSAFRGPSSLAPAILLTSPIGCGAVARVVLRDQASNASACSSLPRTWVSGRRSTGPGGGEEDDGRPDIIQKIPSG